MNYFVDFSLENDGDGLTPTTAYNTLLGKIFDIGDIVWLRRKSFLFSQRLNIISDSVIYIGWPKEGDLYYDMRPESAKLLWDDDLDDYFTLAVNNDPSIFINIIGFRNIFYRMKILSEQNAINPHVVFSVGGYIPNGDDYEMSSVPWGGDYSRFYNCYFHKSSIDTGGWVTYRYSMNILGKNIEMEDCIFDLKRSTSGGLLVMGNNFIAKKLTITSSNINGVAYFKGKNQRIETLYLNCISDSTPLGIDDDFIRFRNTTSIITDIQMTYQGTGGFPRIVIDGPLTPNNWMISIGDVYYTDNIFEFTKLEWDQSDAVSVTLKNANSHDKIQFKNIESSTSILICYFAYVLNTDGSGVPITVNNIQFYNCHVSTPNTNLIYCGSIPHGGYIISPYAGKFWNTKISYYNCSEVNDTSILDKNTFSHSTPFKIKTTNAYIETSNIYRSGGSSFSYKYQITGTPIDNDPKGLFNMADYEKETIKLMLNSGANTIILYGAYKNYTITPTADYLWFELEYVDHIGNIQTLRTYQLYSDSSSWTDSGLTSFKLQLILVNYKIQKANIRLFLGAPIDNTGIMYIDPFFVLT